MGAINGHRMPAQANFSHGFFWRLFHPGAAKAKSETPQASLLEKCRGKDLRSVLGSPDGLKVAGKLFAGSPLKLETGVTYVFRKSAYVPDAEIRKLEETVLKDFALAALREGKKLEDVLLGIPFHFKQGMTWATLMKDFSETVNPDIQKYLLVEGETLKLSPEIITFMRDRITSAGFVGPVV